MDCYDPILLLQLPDDILQKLESLHNDSEKRSYVQFIEACFGIELSTCYVSHTQAGECEHIRQQTNIEEGIVSCLDCFLVLERQIIVENRIDFSHSVCVVKRAEYSRKAVILKYLESVLCIRVKVTPKKINEMIITYHKDHNLNPTPDSIRKCLREKKQSQYFKYIHSFLYNCFSIRSNPLCSCKDLRNLIDSYVHIDSILSRFLKRKNMIKCDYILRKICPPHLQHCFKKCSYKCERKYDELWNKIMNV